MGDFVSRYVDIVTPYADAPESFIEASAYHVVSSTLGRFFWCPSTPNRVKPNVWFIISSIPGRMRRSTILNYANYTYRNALFKFYKETGERPPIKEGKVKKVKEVTDDKLDKWLWGRVRNSIMEEGTPEGIADHLQYSKLKSYTIMSTEFGGVFKRMYGRTYQAGVSTMFSKLYYGEGGTMYLSRRGGKRGLRYIPEGLYVTMLAGMQEPEQYLTTDMIRQGLLRRIVIIFVETKELKRWLEPIRIGREQIYIELKEYAGDLAKKMIEFRDIAEEKRPHYISVNFAPKVTSFINTYARQLDDALKGDASNVNIYLQSLWEHLAKLSALRAIAKGKLTGIAGQLDLNIREEDLQKAKAFLTDAVKHSEEMIEQLGAERMPIRSYKDPLERIYHAIANAGSEGIQHSALYRKLGNMRKDEIEALIDTLWVQGRVIRELVRKGPKRTPAILYKTKEE